MNKPNLLIPPDIVRRIKDALPDAHVTLVARDNLFVAAVASVHTAFERKGATEEEATLRLLDSVMQWKAEQDAAARRLRRTGDEG